MTWNDSYTCPEKLREIIKRPLGQSLFRITWLICRVVVEERLKLRDVFLKISDEVSSDPEPMKRLIMDLCDKNREAERYIKDLLAAYLDTPMDLEVLNEFGFDWVFDYDQLVSAIRRNVRFLKDVDDEDEEEFAC